MIERVKVVALCAAVVGLVFVPAVVGPPVAAAWMWLIRGVGAFVVARFLIRWAARRHRAAPGMHGFVPQKTPWAP